MKNKRGINNWVWLGFIKTSCTKHVLLCFRF